MGPIETDIDLPKDLTTYKVVGKVALGDFLESLSSYYQGEVTPLTLWDFTAADITAMASDEISHLAEYASTLAVRRQRGRTAIVFDAPLDFGLGRMFETHLEMTGLPLEVRLFRNLADAREWLGIDTQMVAHSTIYQIGNCIQKTKAGRLDCMRLLNLVHELSVAVYAQKDADILIDLRNAEVLADMQDLMVLAEAGARYKSLFEGKIAILIPDATEQIAIADRFKSLMEVQGFRLEHFFDHDAAIEWFSLDD